MTADVYAGDQDLTVRTQNGDVSTYRYSVIADADPDALVRVAMMLALANVSPIRLSMESIDQLQVRIDADIPVSTPQTADFILRKILQLTSVSAAHCKVHESESMTR